MEIAIYILIINLVGFLSMGLDKYKAKRGAYRISEKALFIIALIGGSIGSIIGMYKFHHKTKKNAFVFGMPMILVTQIVLILMYVGVI